MDDKDFRKKIGVIIFVIGAVVLAFTHPAVFFSGVIMYAGYSMME